MSPVFVYFLMFLFESRVKAIVIDYYKLTRSTKHFEVWTRNQNLHLHELSIKLAMEEMRKSPSTSLGGSVVLLIDGVCELVGL